MYKNRIYDSTILLPVLNQWLDEKDTLAFILVFKLYCSNNKKILTELYNKKCFFDRGELFRKIVFLQTLTADEKIQLATISFEEREKLIFLAIDHINKAALQALIVTGIDYDKMKHPTKNLPILHQIVILGYTELLDAFENSGINFDFYFKGTPNNYYVDKGTALLWAARYANHIIGEKLIKLGVDCNKKCGSDTPLIQSIWGARMKKGDERQKHLNFIKLLLSQSKIDLSPVWYLYAKNQFITPREFAEKLKEFEIADAIKEAESKQEKHNTNNTLPFKAAQEEGSLPSASFDRTCTFACSIM